MGQQAGATGKPAWRTVSCRGTRVWGQQEGRRSGEDRQEAHPDCAAGRAVLRQRGFWGMPRLVEGAEEETQVSEVTGSHI